MRFQLFWRLRGKLPHSSSLVQAPYSKVVVHHWSSAITLGTGMEATIIIELQVDRCGIYGWAELD